MIKHKLESLNNRMKLLKLLRSLGIKTAERSIPLTGLAIMMHNSIEGRNRVMDRIYGVFKEDKDRPGMRDYSSDKPKST